MQREIPHGTPVVEIDSSDDECGTTVPPVVSIIQKNLNHPAIKASKVETTAQTTLFDPNTRPLGSQSFWKAGAYEIGPSKSLREQGDLEHARVHPTSFCIQMQLLINGLLEICVSTAIAELLDNAVDEIDNGATYVKVDRILNKKDNSPVLLFQDDGGGMDPEGMRKCMSLGYSTKTSNNTIGQYGNGFKTSTMRLGADAIVFSRASRSGRATQSIGLLSYSFLRRTGQDDVIVPMIDFGMSDNWPEPIFCSSPIDWSTNLQTILEWSPFESKDDLMLQFEDIGSHGTKILIYNLWLNDEGVYELNFDDKEEDIRLKDEVNQGVSDKANRKLVELQAHISYRIRYSLRAYASMLYLRKFTNFKIILRGKAIEQLDIVEDLKHTTVITYKPQNAASGEVVETKIGFVKEAPTLAVSGFNVYHKNRLIRPFWKVTADGSSKGNGVIGVLEANFIEPAHDKQDFERSNLFYRLEARLKQMVFDYWKAYSHLVGFKPVPGSPYYVKRDSITQPQVGGAHARKLPQYEHVHLGPPVQGLTTNSLQGSNVAQIGTRKGMSCNNELSSAKTFVRPSRETVPEDTSVDTVRSMSIDQIREENIQLFRRCEENMQKENNLVFTIGGIEKELEETKKKCAQLSSHIENQKKQQLMLKQT